MTDRVSTSQVADAVLELLDLYKKFEITEEFSENGFLHQLRPTYDKICDLLSVALEDRIVIKSLELHAENKIKIVRTFLENLQESRKLRGE